MNYYEQRLAQLDRTKLPKEVFGDGRDNRTTNEEYWKKLKVGDKVFVTAWFLRDMYDVSKVAEVAANGLTVIEKGFVDDREGEWKWGSWHEKRFNCLFFEETERILNFKYSISQQIWKIERNGKIIS